MAFGSQQGKRKKIKKVNHMGSAQLQMALSDLKDHKGSKYYQHILTRSRAYASW